jgi:hypothetical protein
VAVIITEPYGHPDSPRRVIVHQSNDHVQGKTGPPVCMYPTSSPARHPRC